MRLSILAKIIDMLSPATVRFAETGSMARRKAFVFHAICSCPEPIHGKTLITMRWQRCSASYSHRESLLPLLLQGPCLHQQHSLSTEIQSPPGSCHRLGNTSAQEGMKVHFFDDIDGIIPIPLAPHRQRQRGYNQSEEIAKGIAQVTHLPIYTNIVRRNVFKESQTQKDRWRRNENVKEAFELYPSYRPDQEKGKNKSGSIAGRHFLMVDDVCTTGATICACCQTLLKAGNMKFSVLSIGLAGE